MQINGSIICRLTLTTVLCHGWNIALQLMQLCAISDGLLKLKFNALQMFCTAGAHLAQSCLLLINVSEGLADSPYQSWNMKAQASQEAPILH